MEGRQEDAEEFLTCLLNGVSDEIAAGLKAHLQALERTQVPVVQPVSGSKMDLYFFLYKEYMHSLHIGWNQQSSNVQQNFMFQFFNYTKFGLGRNKFWPIFVSADPNLDPDPDPDPDPTLQ